MNVNGLLGNFQNPDCCVGRQTLQNFNRDDYNNIGLEDFEFADCFEVNERKALRETRFIDEHSATA